MLMIPLDTFPTLCLLVLSLLALPQALAVLASPGGICLAPDGFSSLQEGSSYHSGIASAGERAVDDSKAVPELELRTKQPVSYATLALLNATALPSNISSTSTSFQPSSSLDAPVATLDTSTTPSIPSSPSITPAPSSSDRHTSQAEPLPSTQTTTTLGSLASSSSPLSALSAVSFPSPSHQSSTTSTSTHSPLHSPFLSFEEWKALQLAHPSSQHKPSPSPAPSSPKFFHHTSSPEERDPPEDRGTSDGSHEGKGSSEGGKGPPDASTNPSLPISSSTTLVPPPKPTKAKSAPSRRFNYASLDCSARIHFSSPLTKSPSALLHKSKDRYMLTPCSASSHYVVLELCDEIRIDTLEIGSFEFFSSIIKEVRVRAGETEGVGSVDGEGEGEGWKDLGTFKLANVRGMQPLLFDPPTAFHRYLRLDFIGHYGKEYYCPISLLRAYGRNQMEAYRYESKMVDGRKEEEERLREEEWRAASMVGSKEQEGSGSEEEVGTERFGGDGASGRWDEGVDGRGDEQLGGGTSPLSTLSTANEDGPSPSTSSPLSRLASSSVPNSLPSSSLSRTLNTAPAPAGSTSSASPLGSRTSSLSITTNGSTETVRSSNLTPTNSVACTSSSPIKRSSAQSISSSSPSSSSSSSSPSPLSYRNSVPPQVKQNNSNSLPSSALPVPPPPPPPVQHHQHHQHHQQPHHASPSSADSGESIYAFITRRLSSLESSNSLSTSYVSQQSSAMRDALEQIREEWRSFETRSSEEANERWRTEGDTLRSSQARLLRSFNREFDGRSRSLEAQHALLLRQLEILDQEIVLHRKLLALALVLLVTILTCFFAIRFGSIEMMPVSVRAASQRVRERSAARRAGSGTSTVTRDALSLEKLPIPPSPHSISSRRSPRPPPTSPVDPSSPSLHRPSSPARPPIRIRHHSATPQKRALSLSFSSSPSNSTASIPLAAPIHSSPVPAATSSSPSRSSFSSGRFSPASRSSLQLDRLHHHPPQHRHSLLSPGGSSSGAWRRTAAARNAHLHSVSSPASTTGRRFGSASQIENLILTPRQTATAKLSSSPRVEASSAKLSPSLFGLDVEGEGSDGEEDGCWTSGIGTDDDEGGGGGSSVGG